MDKITIYLLEEKQAKRKGDLESLHLLSDICLILALRRKIFM